MKRRQASVSGLPEEASGFRNPKPTASLLKNLGEKVKISGFGNFAVRSKRERVGRNPHTGQELKITGRRVVTFKASHILKRAVNTIPPDSSS